jgi:hypothetical protein
VVGSCAEYCHGNFFAVTTVYYSVWVKATDTLAASIVEEDATVNNKKMRKAIERMKGVTDETRNSSIMGALFYIIFSIPYLIPFQTYLYAFAIFLMAGKGHMVYFYLEGKDTIQVTESDGAKHGMNDPKAESGAISHLSNKYTSVRVGVPKNVADPSPNSGVDPAINEAQP